MSSLRKGTSLSTCCAAAASGKISIKEARLRLNTRETDITMELRRGFAKGAGPQSSLTFAQPGKPCRTRKSSSAPETQCSDYKTKAEDHHGSELHGHPELERVDPELEPGLNAINLLIEARLESVEPLIDQREAVLHVPPQNLQILLGCDTDLFQIPPHRQADSFQIVIGREAHPLEILLGRQRGAHVPLHRIHDRPRLV